MRQQLRKAPDYEQALRAALLDGKPVPEAAQLAGISRATAFRWFAAHRAELIGTAFMSSPIGRLFRRGRGIGSPMGL